MCVFDVLVIMMILCIYYLLTLGQHGPKDQLLKNELELMAAQKELVLVQEELVLVQEELVTLRAELVRLHLQDVECQSFRKKIWNHLTEIQHNHAMKMTRHAHSWHGSSYAKYQSL
jgi:hypothetical protein